METKKILKMKNKVSQVLDFIIEQLEAGKLKGGDKLPGSREIAGELKISLAKIQQSLNLLVKEGILESFPRRGTFVQHNWNERILQHNMSLFTEEERLPWLSMLKEALSREIPELRISRAFPKSVFEIRTTWTVQSEQANYMDLSQILRECYPDETEFFTHPFKTFYIGRKLCGIPIIFSPRVIFYNFEILEKAGCQVPSNNWTWSDFISYIQKIKQAVPGGSLINWRPEPHLFMNIIFRAGGELLSSDSQNPIMIDHPKTRLGLKLFRELRETMELKIPDDYEKLKKESFFKGKMAFMISAREDLPFIEKAGFKWGTVPLPRIEGGLDITAQATDLLCVRNSCTDMNIVRKLIRFMLSEKFQDYIGKIKYGIPIRKSSAIKSVSMEDLRDFLFMAEAPKITAGYNIDSPELAMMIRDGIAQILETDVDIDISTKKLTDAVRTFLNIKNFKCNNGKELLV
jgi:ABC-type glycerol-3-phosphate transport system substrate-binding protein/DNA-binding transcriptional regulator YhcF (GntR family)